MLSTLVHVDSPSGVAGPAEAADAQSDRRLGACGRREAAGEAAVAAAAADRLGLDAVGALPRRFDGRIGVRKGRADVAVDGDIARRSAAAAKSAEAGGEAGLAEGEGARNREAAVAAAAADRLGEDAVGDSRRSSSACRAK